MDTPYSIIFFLLFLFLKKYFYKLTRLCPKFMLNLSISDLQTPNFKDASTIIGKALSQECNHTGFMDSIACDLLLSSSCLCLGYPISAFEKLCGEFF